LRLLDDDADGALQDFEMAQRRNPNSPQSYSDRGVAWLSKRDYAKALQDFDRAIGHPGMGRLTIYQRGAIYCMRGIAYMAQDQTDRAIADFEKADRICRRELALAIYQRGLAYLSQDNTINKAIADFSKAIRMNPVADAAYNGRGLAWLKQGMPKRAIDDFRLAVRCNKDLAFVRTSPSRVLYDQLVESGKWKSETAKDINPSQSAYYNLVMVLAASPEEGRDGTSALRHGKRLCDLDKNQFYAFRSAVAAAAAEVGDFAEARRWQQEAIDLAPDDEKIQKELKERMGLYEANKRYRMSLKGRD
jgi:tetratricopeptide (TPR) repeat protein